MSKYFFFHPGPASGTEKDYIKYLNCYLMFCRAIAEKHGSVGLLHIDAHSDTAPDMMGERLAHGTPFRYYIASTFNISEISSRLQFN